MPWKHPLTKGSRYHTQTKGKGPLWKVPCDRICPEMFLGITGGNPICTEMNSHPPLHFHKEGLPTMLTLVKKSDTCANVYFLHVKIVIQQCVNTFFALWECKVYKNTLSKIVSYTPQANFILFGFFCLSRIICAGWKAQKTTCRSTVNPFLQADFWEEWNWDTGGEHCFVCANSSAQEHCSEEHIWTVSNFSTAWARPKKSCPSFCPFSAPQLWTLFACSGCTWNPPCSTGKACMREGFLQDVSL